MPMYYYDPDPAYYRARDRAVKKITAELVDRGMKPGHGKFDDVVRDKLKKKRYWS